MTTTSGTSRLDRRARWLRTAGTVLTAVTSVLAGLAGCDGGPERAPRITGGAPSLDALGQEAWTALVAGDTAGLRRLRLTEREHNELVWPELPASASEAGFPVDFAWQNIRTRNAAAVADLLAVFGGSGARLLDTRCAGSAESYATFRILRECGLVLEWEDGTERRLEAFRHVLEMDGRYKIFRYYSDE